MRARRNADAVKEFEPYDGAQDGPNGVTEGIRELKLVAKQDRVRPGPVLPTNHARPRTRGECAGVQRPCPFVGCRHHLYLDVGSDGAIKFNFPDILPHEMKHSCSLDVADQLRGSEGQLEVVGVLMNLTRERVRQVQNTAQWMASTAMLDHAPDGSKLPVLTRKVLPGEPVRKPRIRARKEPQLAVEFEPQPEPQPERRGLKGTTYSVRDKRWTAQAWVDGKVVRVGSGFATEEDAHDAYRAFVAKNAHRR